MLRIEVIEQGHGALPPVDVDDPVIILGSGPTARVRLPAEVALAEHVHLEAGRWQALGPLALVDEASPPSSDSRVAGSRLEPGASGDIGDGVTLALGNYRIRIAPAPAGASASPMQRTESLARELMRNLLGTAGAPTLEIERGAHAGAKRPLPPPESKYVIGRGDEADWIIADKDLSRTHAEIRRSWNGTRIVDLGSKNGTKVDGERIGSDGAGTLLHDGCTIELGPIVMRFEDPAERRLNEAPAVRMHVALEERAAAERAAAERAATRRARGRGDAGAGAGTVGRGFAGAGQLSSRDTGRRGNPVLFFGALTIMIAALAALAWILSSS